MEMMIRGSEESLVPQRRSLSLVMVEGQPVAIEEQQYPVGLPVIGGAVMSRFSRRRL